MKNPMTKNEMNLLYDSFNGHKFNPKSSAQEELFNAEFEPYIFLNHNVNHPEFIYKIQNLNEDEAILIVQKICSFWDEIYVPEIGINLKN